MRAQPAARGTLCRSSRQAADKRAKLYEEGDENPSDRSATGPFPIRDLDEAAEPAPRADADSLRLAHALAAAADDVKAVDIELWRVGRVVSWTRYVVLATAFSRPQVDAAVSRAVSFAAAPPPEGPGRELAHHPEPSSWVCMDFGDVVAHVFTPGDRAFYNLSHLYAKAERVPLPFEVRRGA